MKTYEDLEHDVVKTVREFTGQQICKKVIRNLMQMPSTVPEDNQLGLYTFWNSICFQMQVETSFFFDMYLIDVDKVIEYYVNQLPEYQITALWLYSNEAFDPSADYDVDAYGCIDDVVLVVRNEYLLEAAKSWSNKSIRRAIETFNYSKNIFFAI